ncbi:MAG: rhodanese [Candidatus Marinimicrobia bacterium]|nr:rhodanese [Candidatus Neomarinimicrobiota bacterium]
MNFSEITVKELKQRMDENPKLQVLDVREPFETEIGSIPGTIKIPMTIVPLKLDKLDNKKDIYVYCKSGMRSAKICEFLSYNDFNNIYNVKGGIKAWSVKIDQNIIVG